MRNFRCHDLAVEFYKLSKAIKLASSLKEQLSRASASIALNLAEGAARKSSKDQNRFFQIAFSSLRECQSILLLAEQENSKPFDLLDKLAAHLYKLMQYHQN